MLIIKQLLIDQVLPSRVRIGNLQDFGIVALIRIIHAIRVVQRFHLGAGEVISLGRSHGVRALLDRPEVLFADWARLRSWDA